MLPSTPIIDSLEKPSDKGLVEPPMYFMARARSWLPFNNPLSAKPKTDIEKEKPVKEREKPVKERETPVKERETCQGMQPETDRYDIAFYLMDLAATIAAIFMAVMAFYRQRTILNGALVFVAVFLRYVYLAFRLFTFWL
jgi:hypothetical protein